MVIIDFTLDGHHTNIQLNIRKFNLKWPSLIFFNGKSYFILNLYRYMHVLFVLYNYYIIYYTHKLSSITTICIIEAVCLTVFKR